LVRASEVAGAQWGVIGLEQLSHCGISRSTMRTWRAAGYAHLILPRVLALGHKRIPTEGRLTAALIFAGPGAVLSIAAGSQTPCMTSSHLRRSRKASSSRC